MIKQKTPLKLISDGNHTNKGKSSLTSLVACFVLGKVHCKAIWSILMRWLASKSFTSKEAVKSSINVSLTYLKGLEIPELTEDDMPMV